MISNSLAQNVMILRFNGWIPKRILVDLPGQNLPDGSYIMLMPDVFWKPQLHFLFNES